MATIDRLTESYVFYVHNDQDEGSSTPEPAAPCLLPGEGEICSPCKRVIFYPCFSDHRQGVLGSLHCSVLRLIFVPMMESDTVRFPTSKIFHCFRYEIALFNVHSIHCATNADRKKYKPLTSFLQHSDQISLVKIYCKDFRVFTFDFKMSPDAYKMLLNCLLKHSFLNHNLDSVINSALIFNKEGSNNEWQHQSFDKRTNWELELKRLNVLTSAFRVTHLNDCYRHIESYPQFFVVSSSWPDNKIVEACGLFCERRVPVWCWSSPTGQAIIRSAKINTTSEVVDKHWHHIENAVAQSHPERKMPTTIDVGISTKEIATSAESLRKLCSIESPTTFWDVDSRWNTELEQTGWLILVSKCLAISENVIRLIVDESKSVIVREGTNSDVACIVSCLAQLCLDKFFRSFEGFHMLIQKEWVALAHPFATRLSGLLRTGRCDDEMAPVFLLFLDCVHQLCVQFPSEFEFSQFYLIALWDLALTGLTKTFLFNHLKDCSNIKDGSKLRNAWSTSAFYKSDYMKLFRNPVYTFINGLVPLERNETPSRTTSKMKILRAKVWVAVLDVWDACFLRWSAASQVLRGGAVQTYVDTLDICANISDLLKEILFVDDTSTTPSIDAEEKLLKNKILRRYLVSPLDLDAASVDAITSGFPYSFETLPIPDCLYTVPVRTEVQTQNNNNTSRSLLELTTTTESQVDVRRLSVSRLAMETNYDETNRIEALQLNQFWSPHNRGRYSLRTGPSASTSSPQMNNVVCELQNAVRFRLLQPSMPTTPPLALQEDDFLNTSV